MTTLNDQPTWCEAMCLALDAAPLILKRWREDSDMIKRAHAALIEHGDIATCNEILGDLVEKIGRVAHIGSAANIGKAYDPDQGEEFSAVRIRLLEKRDALLAMRAQLRQQRGRNIGKDAPVPAAIRLPPGVVSVAAAVRLNKSELIRREDLQTRLDQLKARLNAQRDPSRNWQPLQEA
jgi:hypothetical protein